MKGTRGTAQFNLRLPSDIREKLQAHADKQERSLTWTINSALKDWTDQNEHKLERKAA